MARRKQIPIKEEIRTKISGVMHDDPRSGLSRQELIRRYVYPGMQLIPKRDRKNPYDDHAVMLLFEKREGLRKKQFHLGYVPRLRSETVDKMLKNKIPIEVIVTAVTGGTETKPTRGVNIVIRYSV